MKIVEGEITMLGGGDVYETETKYRVIEIGGAVIQKVIVPRPLVPFLRRACENEKGNSRLHLKFPIIPGGYKMLIGMELPDGKSYCYGAKTLSGIFLLAIGIPTIPLLGIGLFFLWAGLSEIGVGMAAGALKKKGAVALRQ